MINLAVFFKRSLLIIAILFIGLAGATISKAQGATLEQMAGQMILLGFQGDKTSAKSVADTRLLIQQGRIGGVMYLKFNVSSLANVKAMNEGFLSTGATLPPFIAIDQEGGSIERLTRSVGFKEIQSAYEIARGQSAANAKRIYGAMARDLAALKFNLNFGPVVDLNINKNNPIIARYGRSFSDNAKDVITYASAFVKGHREANMLTSLKHFPGHGSSEKDSHLGFVDITKSWQIEELEPYREMVQNNMVDMVMIAHLYHQEFSGTGKKLPSSLSPNWITGVLRNNIGYNGVVISDDLEMKAIRDNFTLRDTVLLAISAGTDILLFSNTANYRISLADEVRAIIVNEAKRNPVFRAQVEASYARIRNLKDRIVF
ncbi:MAG: glycoside hydrolase family 3 protein [Devosiaceae bacterium]|nr:glycoside hydrolase family 3 protein [Devosiaceae bacterium]